MSRIFTKGATRIVTMMLLLALALVLAACSSNNGKNNTADTPPPANNAGNNNTPKTEEPPADEPVEIETITVTLWDRGTQPEGSAKMEDNIMYKWINEQLAPLGVKVEYAQIPRSEESAKLTTWLASGDPPDILISYDASVLYRYAELGGLRPLDDLLDQYGDNIKKNNAIALDQIGVYKGERYSIPAIRAAKGGRAMSIRADWLEAINMEVPNTIDELTEVLRAFRDQDPGGVGANNVIPWGLPALTGGQATFFYHPMMAFGVDNDGPGPEGMYMPAGTYENGTFTSGFATDEGKEYFRWMNQMYKEGILPREFATDVESQQYKQDFANGYVGFFEANNPAQSQNIEVRKTYPEATYIHVPPFINPDGERIFDSNASYGMHIMIPKTTSDAKAAAAMKYLNWMAQEDVIKALNWGLEGVHYEMVDGARVVEDPTANLQDLWIFGSGDLEIIQQGVPAPEDLEGLIKWYTPNASFNSPEEVKEFAELTFEFNKMIDEIGQVPPVIYTQRPLDEKSGANIGKYLSEAISKVIIAPDFDAEYAKLISGWEGLGGRDWDKELGDVMAEQGL